MKVNSVKIGGDLWRHYCFEEKELLITVKGYQYLDDEIHEHDPNYEVKGEIFPERSYHSLRDAMKRCIELLDKGWEVVKLFIGAGDECTDDEFNVWIHGNLRQGVTFNVSLNLTELSKLKQRIEEARK